MDDEELRKTLREMNARIFDMKTQLLADRNRMATRNQLSDLNDKVSNRLLYLAVGGMVVVLIGLFAMSF